jgi:hypothetical protein
VEIPHLTPSPFSSQPEVVESWALCGEGLTKFTIDVGAVGEELPPLPNTGVDLFLLLSPVLPSSFCLNLEKCFIMLEFF